MPAMEEAPTPSDPSMSVGSSKGEDTDTDRVHDFTSSLDTSVSTMPRIPSQATINTESPSASITLLRTNETLDSLARQLNEFEHSRLLESDPDLSARCCCGALSDCPTLAARDRVETKLKLCGEIGTALMQRYEALEQKYQHAEKQVEIKRKALADSLRHVANLERANTTHLTKYAEQARAHDALEKRYNQAMHSQTLTQQSLTHVRNELAQSRTKTSQSISLALEKTYQTRLAEAERRFEDARTLYHAESKKLREELKWRKMAEDRIADLEVKLVAAGREVEDIKGARTKDAQDLLANAKQRLEILHSELSESFGSEHPSETPEYQRTLEDLVASNALLKHDSSELARTLTLTMEENRTLQDEVEELRQAARLRQPRPRPLSTELRPLLMRGATHHHTRTRSTGSSPIPEASDESRPPGHARVASAAIPRTAIWSHRRYPSLAPSLASISTTTDGMSVTSPDNELGLNTQGDISRDGPSPLSPDAETLAMRRRSSSGGIRYVHNGVPKRPRARNSLSDRRSLQMRVFGVEEAINEPKELDQSQSCDETHSGDDSYSASESTTSARKRASVFLPGVRASPRHSFDSPVEHTAGPFDYAFGHSDSTAGPQTAEQKRVGRRTLLLLSRSMGVQTDPIPEAPESPTPSPRKTRPEREPEESPTVALSETSSIHEMRVASGGGPVPTIAELVDFLSKVLTRLKGVDIPTLNRRLKKQNLPSDVGHVSRTTISALQTEIASMRHRFRGLLDQSNVSRREAGLLLTLLREVFTGLLDLQSTVNSVTLDPKIAKKLRREAFEDVQAKEAEEAPRLGLWGIAAPITNYFLPSVQKAPDPTPPSPTKSRPPPGRSAPKLPASTSASTASVTVEFGGTSGTRGVTAAPQKSRLAVVTAGDVFDSDADPNQRSVSAPVPTASGSRLADMRGVTSAIDPPRVRTRASRSDLMGIFAGAQGPSTTPRVRHMASQHFGGANRGNERRQRLSTIVDAMLDPCESAVEDEDGPLLERTLRPRGLSDSSIHSNAMLDSLSGQAPLTPGPASMAKPVPARALATATTFNPSSDSATTSAAGSMFGTISRRLYSLRSDPVGEPSVEREKLEVRSCISSTSSGPTATDMTRDTSRDAPRTPSLTIPSTTTAIASVSCTSAGVSPSNSFLANMRDDESREVPAFSPGSLGTGIARWRA